VNAEATAVILARVAVVVALDAGVALGPSLEHDAEGVAAIRAAVDPQAFRRRKTRAKAVAEHARDRSFGAVRWQLRTRDAARIAAPCEDATPVEAFDFAWLDVHLATGVARAVERTLEPRPKDWFRAAAAAVASHGAVGRRLALDD
jgi:hypothetical protein